MKVGGSQSQPASPPAFPCTPSVASLGLIVQRKSFDRFVPSVLLHASTRYAVQTLAWGAANCWVESESSCGRGDYRCDAAVLTCSLLGVSISLAR